MPDDDALDTTNRILSALPPEQLRALRPALERLELTPGDRIHRTGERVSSVYFIERGMVSLVKEMADGQCIELAAVGREGFTPGAMLYGAGHAVTDAVVQLPGEALRIPRQAFGRALWANPGLTTLVRGYARLGLSQIAQTAACNARHTVEQRCARWLLTAHDNAGSDSFTLTHEFLSMMLGVRRASVSQAAEVLQAARRIQYGHGRLTILDRAALERTACGCYATIRAELDGLFRDPIISS